MSVFTSLGILFLSLFACAFLQLAPSVFAIFYHYASARNSRKKALDLSSFFTVGMASFIVIVLLLLSFIIINFMNDNPALSMDIFAWIIAGLLIAIGIFVFCFYYRKGDGTQLYISRKIAKSITSMARNAKKPSDVFALGLAVGVAEVFLTLPIYCVVTYEIINFPGEIIWKPVLFILFVILSLIPTMSIRGQFLMRERNLAEIQRSHVKNKNFFRFLIGFSYLLLAATIICFRIF